MVHIAECNVYRQRTVPNSFKSAALSASVAQQSVDVSNVSTPVFDLTKVQLLEASRPFEHRFERGVAMMVMHAIGSLPFPQTSHQQYTHDDWVTCLGVLIMRACCCSRYHGDPNW